jgi:hypothetical protein
MTDESSAYTKVGREFAEHGFTKHGIGEYVRGDIHSNTVESYFSIFKRGLMGAITTLVRNTSSVTCASSISVITFDQAWVWAMLTALARR